MEKEQEKVVRALVENTPTPLLNTVFGNESKCTGFAEVRVGSYQSSVTIRLFISSYLTSAYGTQRASLLLT